TNHWGSHYFFNSYINRIFTNGNSVSNIFIRNNSNGYLILKNQYGSNLSFRHHFSNLGYGISFTATYEVFNEFNGLKFKKFWGDFFLVLLFGIEFSSVLSRIWVSSVGSKAFN